VVVFIFFHVITWTWVFFHAPSINMALDMTWKMIHTHASNVVTHPLFLMIVGLFLLHVIEYLLRTHETKIGRIWHYVPFPVRSAVYLLLTISIFYFAKGEKYEFIYFQF
jgi:alginate O-acetyltransferase complex protein AlgI